MDKEIGKRRGIRKANVERKKGREKNNRRGVGEEGSWRRSRRKTRRTRTRIRTRTRTRKD